MSTVITFYIARHGKTMMNTLDRVQGWCDSPLTNEGIEVAGHLGKGLRDIKFESVYTSDLRRTRQTALVVLEEQGQTDLDIVEKEGFREACFGGYEADFNSKMWGDAALYLHYTSTEKMYYDVFNKKISQREVLDAIHELDKTGLAESYDQLETRTQTALRRIAEDESKKGKDLNVLVVAHGMSILTMLYSLGGKELLESHLENASVCKVIYSNGKFKVESMGDLQYVEKGRKLI